MSGAIHLQHVGVDYGQGWVLEAINHSFEPGQCHIIMGPNGGGKTSLFRSVLGLTPFVGDISVQWPSGRVGRLGYVPQKAIFEQSLPLTVLDFVLLNLTKVPLFLAPLWPGFKQQRAQALASLTRVGMAQRAHLRMGQLSGGEQQRVLFAQALLHHPDVLILDEPTTGMDEAGVQYLENLMHELVAQGKTILAVHHDIAAVRRILARTPGKVHIVNHHLVDSGPVEDVLTSAKIETLFQHFSARRA
ncbi:metal ABC transporter ATP-binding protein [Motilimonas pumila]|uniref:Metal ABC transporter ATP-binding protein n=1 Tax=Motilimonas pumila TaxID=2303987 RepID=A0A418YEY6_9GAMM|nr:metal ABC transporter ATP-binding protein [Motilimonas pumila]RJG47749.1 metal ABC transporter ATP-binding protein [Motilimonas pumila]